MNCFGLTMSRLNDKNGKKKIFPKSSPDTKQQERLSNNLNLINVRENRRGNQVWTIQTTYYCVH